MTERLVWNANEQILDTYTLALVGPVKPVPLRDAQKLMAFFNEAEEILTNLLPDGYRVVITEWSSDE